MQGDGPIVPLKKTQLTFSELPTEPELTVRQKLLVAAAHLCREGCGSFDTGDLVERAWKMFPRPFSMGNKRRDMRKPYPCSNTVLAKLAGNDGLHGMGWLEPGDEQGQYVITRKGLREFEHLRRRMPRVIAWMFLRAYEECEAVPGALLAEGRTPVGVGLAPAVPPEGLIAVAPIVADAPPVAPTVVEALPVANVPRVEARGRTHPWRGHDMGPKPVSSPLAHIVPRAESAPAPRSDTDRGAIPSVPASGVTPEDILHIDAIVKTNALRKFLGGTPLTFKDACDFWGFAPASRHVFVEERLKLVTDVLTRAVESFGHGVHPRLPALSTCYGLFNLNRLMKEVFAATLKAMEANA